MQFTTALIVSFLAATGMAAPSASHHKRANFPIPASRGSQTFSAAKTVSGTFDGGYKTYGRGVSCTGQKEGGNKDAVFLLEDGATLKNVIIGADQIEGVHCLGKCTIENVWWSAVCEDALTFKGNGDATVIGGGATGADDKVLQHNGAGNISISGFTVVDFGKLYRSCGNCKQNGSRRNVSLKNVKAYSGKSLVGINSNYGDVATFSNTCATSVKEICVEYKGTNNNSEEPSKISSGPSKNCVYTKLSAC
ncbi:pectate lyase [Diplodia corticola]|uniref:Pectate lyase n=1 Tax=Diplodia corticola TaxID=236234 RepID=A0A1J9S7I8_9PEZI|nr:pectate lyase [Diplodia corticola]OJD36455.1 pectate lyase [Diplodia corticola]